MDYNSMMFFIVSENKKITCKIWDINMIQAPWWALINVWYKLGIQFEWNQYFINHQLKNVATSIHSV